MTDVSLSQADAAFVAEQVAQGHFADAEDTVRVALQLLREAEEEDAELGADSEAAIAEGLADFEAGRYEEVDVNDIGGWLESVRKRAVGA